MRERLKDVVDRFAGTRVAVLADLVLDEFVHGAIARVSREAPVLILDYLGTDALPGGGANAVNNVRALGGVPIPVGVVGDDEAGRRLTFLLREAGIDTSRVSTLAGFVTPTKSRVLAGLTHSRAQQVIRIDRGSASRVAPEEAGAAADRARALLGGEGGGPAVKGLLLSDYGYDLVTPQACRLLIEEAGRVRVPVTCDSRHRLEQFQGVTAATPNLEEAEQLLGTPLDGAGGGAARLGDAARSLMERLRCRALLITRGSRGMTLLEDGVAPFDIPVFGSDQVADVTGAGDTVIATFTLAVAAGATCRMAALLANAAAGLVVMKRATATVTASELKHALDRLPEGRGD
ncbi:MAG TPA: PfkB family carbohydrate kinase [Candidatus Polarisedimenticolia bacterium]|nr:PfkB family carbohydrate kinase [Candidatus Polarisedimenticolia bacterium]